MQAKPLPGTTGIAVLLINPDTKPHEFVIPLANLPRMGSGANITGGAAAVDVRDIWNHKDLAPLAKGTASITATVQGLDSAFMILKPE